MRRWPALLICLFLNIIIIREHEMMQPAMLFSSLLWCIDGVQPAILCNTQTSTVYNFYRIYFPLIIQEARMAEASRRRVLLYAPDAPQISRVRRRIWSRRTCASRRRPSRGSRPSATAGRASRRTSSSDATPPATSGRRRGRWTAARRATTCPTSPPTRSTTSECTPRTTWASASPSR